MAEPYLAQITLFAGNFAIRGWAFCSGQLLPISQNTALFSILGTIYGGDGRTTFALPDLRGRSPRGSENGSAGPGLQPVQLGARGGSPSHTLTIAEMPNHDHAAPNNAIDEDANLAEAAGNSLGEKANSYVGGAPKGVCGATTTGSRGGNQSFGILNPYLGLNYLIATQGVFPSRN